MQLFAKQLEVYESDAHELAMYGADNWIKRENGNVGDAIKAVEEKANHFRSYLNDSTPTHKHKLLFASQYLVEASVQLLRALDKATSEVIVQHTHRVAFVARRLVAASFDAPPGNAAAQPRLSVSTLQSLLGNLLVTLTNATWKRALQLPSSTLRRQLDEGAQRVYETTVVTCVRVCVLVLAAIGVSGRVLIEACGDTRLGSASPNNRRARERSPTPVVASKDRSVCVDRICARFASLIELSTQTLDRDDAAADTNDDESDTTTTTTTSSRNESPTATLKLADQAEKKRSVRRQSTGIATGTAIASTPTTTTTTTAAATTTTTTTTSSATPIATSPAPGGESRLPASPTSPSRERHSKRRRSSLRAARTPSTLALTSTSHDAEHRTWTQTSSSAHSDDSSPRRSTSNHSPRTGAHAATARAAADALTADLAHLATLLSTADDVHTPAPSLVTEVDRARKYLFRVVDAHLSSNLRTPTNAMSKAAAAADNVVAQLALLLKRLVVDFESLKLGPGDGSGGSRVALSGSRVLGGASSKPDAARANAAGSTSTLASDGVRRGKPLGAMPAAAAASAARLDVSASSGSDVVHNSRGARAHDTDTRHVVASNTDLMLFGGGAAGGGGASGNATSGSRTDETAIRAASRVASIRSLASVVRELAQRADGMLRSLPQPPAPAALQVGARVHTQQ
jgi:hypothetical protein